MRHVRPDISACDRPCAAPGLTSYRARSAFGFIMIGARDIDDAWREARRSSDGAHNLEVWDGSRYVPVAKATPREEQTPARLARFRLSVNPPSASMH